MEVALLDSESEAENELTVQPSISRYLMALETFGTKLELMIAHRKDFFADIGTGLKDVIDLEIHRVGELKKESRR